MIRAIAFGQAFSVFAMAALLGNAPAFGQIPAAGAGGGPNPKLAWLKPGDVFTAQWSVMSHPGHAFDFKQDDHGKWVATDGTHLQAQGRPGTSASGLSQVVVSAVGHDRAIIVYTAYTDMRLLGMADPVPQGTPKTLPVDLTQCDIWISPAKLAQMRSDPAAHLVVQPVQWTYNGKPVDAIRVASGGEDHHIDHVYDRASGLCLHAAESSAGAAPQLKYLAPAEGAADDTLFTSFDFLALREAHAPWASEPMPAWTKQFKTLHYQGESLTPNGFGMATPTQLFLNVERQDAGDDWLALRTDGGVMVRGEPRFPTQGFYLCGRDQYDTFFASPGALAKLQKGQMLDTDPITHIEIRVSQADGRSVTIEAANGGSQVYHTFDVQTGKLIAFGRADGMTKIKSSFQLNGEE